MKIPYEERQLGQFYYCLGPRTDITHEYIFQCNDLEGSMFPSIHRLNVGSWCVVEKSSYFKSDWEKGTDQEMRLATPEEIALIKELDEHGLLMDTPEIYSIY